jgi:ATP-dependent RNA helicase RhlE
MSLVCVDEHAFLRDIERLIKRQIPSEVVPGFEPDPNAKPQAVFAQRGRGRPGQGQGPRQGAGPGRGTERNGRSYGAAAKPTGGNPRSRSGPHGDRGNAGHARGAPRQGARFKAA